MGYLSVDSLLKPMSGMNLSTSTSALDNDGKAKSMIKKEDINSCLDFFERALPQPRQVSGPNLPSRICWLYQDTERETLLKLVDGQFAQHFMKAKKRIQQLRFYEREVEAVTVKNKRIVLTIDGLNKMFFSNDKQLKSYLDSLSYRVTWLEKDHYSLRAHIRGLGGGNNQVKSRRSTRSRKESRPPPCSLLQLLEHRRSTGCTSNEDDEHLANYIRNGKIKKKDLNRVNFDNESPLELAIAADCLPAVRALLERGASVNRCGPKGPFLFQAVKKGGELDLCKVLVEFGADIALCKDKYDLISEAVRYDYNIKMLEWLLTLHLPVNRCHVHAAVQARSWSLIPLLINHYQGIIPAEWVIKACRDIGDKRDRGLAAAQEMIQAGCEVNGTNEKGETALDVVLSCAMEDEDKIKRVNCLIDSGATVYAKHLFYLLRSHLEEQNIKEMAILLIQSLEDVNEGDVEYGAPMNIVLKNTRLSEECRSVLIEALYANGARSNINL